MANKQIGDASQRGRGLVLFYKSNNAHANVNYILPCYEVDKFCGHPEAKAELVAALRRVADDIEQDYPREYPFPGTCMATPEDLEHAV